MITDNIISMEVLGKSSGTVDYYCTAPFRCTIADVRARAHMDFGNDDVLTISYSGTTLGTATFGAAMAAGAAATWAENASTGNTVIPSGGQIKVQASAIATPGTGSSIHVDIELDPYARTVDDFS